MRVSRLSAVAAVALAPAVLVAADFRIPRYETYGTDFKLDGKPFESVWTNAPSRDFCFVFTDKGTPKNRTSLRAFYDVDALYVAFYCFESDMKRLQPGFPPEQATDVPIAAGQDCLEFLLSPPGAENRFFHLRIVPSGAKADSHCLVMPDKSCTRDATWNGSWQVKTSQDDTAWYAELRIPFSDCSQGLFGLPVATPTPGTVWRINAGRTESPKGETTAFSKPGLYHLTMEDVSFGGFPWGDIRLSAPQHPMVAGEHEFPLTVENLSDKEAMLQVVAGYAEEECDPAKRREELRKCRWKKPMHRADAYSGTFVLAPHAQTNVTASFSVAQADVGLQTLSVNVNWFRMKHNCSRLWLTGGDDPGVRRRKADAEGPGLLAKQLDALAAKHPGDAFALGTASVYEKVFRDLPYEGSFSPETKISLAQNEYETAHFVLFRLTDKQAPITVTPPKLVGPDGAEIPASAIEVHHVGFINVGDSGHNMHKGYWPDVLYPETVVPVPKKGRVQSVLVTVKAPVGQRPGTYRGTIGFTCGNERHEGALVCEVYPFALPDRMTLGMNFWYHGIYPSWFYQKDPVTGVDFNEMMTLCGKYRFANFLRGGLLSTALRVRLDETAEDGYRFDFSLMDKYQEIAYRNGANALNFDVGWSPHHRIVVDKNGQMQQFKPTDPQKARERLFRELRDHYKEKGWWKFAQLQVGDEPWGEKAQADIRKRVTELREKYGEIPPVITAGAVRGHTNLDGYVDWWCPQFPQYDAKDYRGLKPNEKLWLYQCLYKDDFPSYQIDRPAIEPRITGLICRKTGAQGFLYWTSVQWSSEQEWKKGGKSKDRWVHEDWSLPIKPCPGDGCFTYPTKDRVVPSLRAVYIRDGVEDYEYLAELDRRYAAAKAKGMVPAAVEREVKRLLAIPDDVVRATNEWTHDAAVLDRFRGEVAAAIAALAEVR